MDAETYELQYMRWLFLMDTVHVLRLQGEITNELEEKVVDMLMFSNQIIPRRKVLMKTLKAFIMIFVLAMAVPCFAGQKTTRVYDKHGNLVGTVRKTDVNYQFYDRNNHYTGHASKNVDKSVTFWGRNNEFEGRATCNGSCDLDEHNEDGDE